MICPICANKTRQLFPKNGYWICECQVCRHRCADIVSNPSHVERIYGDHYFQEGGDGYPDYLSEAEILIAHGKRYAQLLTRYMSPGTVLDVGAAAGFILKGFQDCGWHGSGIEPNASMAEYGCNELGLDIKVGSLEQYLGDGHYDLISMIQVVAHFYDLQRAFQVATDLTRQGGFLLIETWNRESIVARVLGSHWHEYSPPSVLNWFSPKGLQQVVAQFGFYEVARGTPSKWLSSAHAISLLSYKLGDSSLKQLIGSLLRVIPDNMSIPYPTLDLFWILFRKNDH